MGRATIIPARKTLLLPYQAAWVKDRSRLKLAEKSRQIGWTWATAYGLVSRKSLQSAALDAWISSRDDIQARLFLEDCKGFSKMLELAARDLGETVVDDKGNTAYTLALANTLRLHSMSSNPDAQAGKRGDRVLDEFALHPDPRKLYSIAYPGITWGGQLEIFSTHRGSGNFFNTLIREIREKKNPKGFSLHRVTLQDALDQGFLYKLQSKLPKDDERQDMDEAAYFDFIRKGAADEEMFQQEYMCVPADDASAFIEWALIDACCYRKGESWDLRMDETPGRELFGGLDIGRDHDLTSFTMLELSGGRYLVRKRIDLKGLPFSEQEARLYPWLAVCKRTCIDQTGIGRQFAERAAQRFGKYKVEGITFTGPMKEELAYPVRSTFEDHAYRLPFTDDALKSDIRAIRKETTPAGNIRFAADRGKNGHADRFWGLALATHAARKPGANYTAHLC
ncbi:terminase large subunit domain-containing protein [Luteolibacter marinus]|uniref:phage terminase large subunit family protein n=1 Tax=Luteolibacter marinus TaxID=2776705 RepID=UPI001868CFFF|nr:terminase family protein [Luteolibacter marinus]